MISARSKKGRRSFSHVNFVCRYSFFVTMLSYTALRFIQPLLDPVLSVTMLIKNITWTNIFDDNHLVCDGIASTTYADTVNHHCIIHNSCLDSNVFC